MRRRTSAIEGHASRANKVMLLDAPLLDQLLGGEVAYCKQDRGCHRLCEEWPRREAGLIPGSKKKKGLSVQPVLLVGYQVWVVLLTISACCFVVRSDPLAGNRWAPTSGREGEVCW